ncbi:MAG: hypothetical protein KA715_01490 [Xanthomonadaceae bacterium]|nr:hypothetical protein [Xanthomonadaceae bacterium]
MKTTKLLALASIFGGLQAYAQGPVAMSTIIANSDVGSDLPVDPAATLVQGKAKAEALFTNFGVRKLSNGSYMLLGTIPSECATHITLSPISAPVVMNDKFAGGWVVEDKSGAGQACVDLFQANKKTCNARDCVSISKIKGSQYSLSDIDTDGLSDEQVKALPDLKIGLFWRDDQQDTGSPTYIQAESIDEKVTFTSPSIETVKIKEAAVKAEQEKIEGLKSDVAECIDKGTGVDEAKKAIRALEKLGEQLGGYTKAQAKEKLAEIEDAQFKADIAAAYEGALADRNTIIKNVNKWLKKRPKAIDEIADARLEIVKRLLSGTELTEAEDVNGVTREDNEEAYKLLVNTGRLRGISKTKSQDIAVQIAALNSKVINEYAATGNLSSRDLLKATAPLDAKMNRVCSPQSLLQIRQMSQQSMTYQNNSQMGLGFGIQAHTYGGMNNGYGMQQQQYLPQQQSSQYNDTECWGAYQQKQQLVQLKAQSDQVRQNKIFAAQNPGYQPTAPIVPNGFQQVTSNLFSTQQGMQPQQQGGMWNNNPEMQSPMMGPSNTFNPNSMMMYQNPMMQQQMMYQQMPYAYGMPGFNTGVRFNTGVGLNLGFGAGFNPMSQYGNYGMQYYGG